MAKKLFVAHVPYRMSAQSLLQTLRSQGPVERAWLAIDRKTGCPSGHAYAEVRTPGDADKLVTRINGKRVLGQLLTVVPIVG